MLAKNTRVQPVYFLYFFRLRRRYAPRCFGWPEEKGVWGKGNRRSRLRFSLGSLTNNLTF